ncbi:hypothetical protein GE061_020065 [Apolygus lucorum]|uniref:Uncharacterized protein n=1 Tax=Apolygus lucorum TaxID=248454 RepID=A0A8S9X9X6_APOLU|nr:hypothetical protein GE061_020065 [Apolygus lucorum]
MESGTGEICPHCEKLTSAPNSRRTTDRNVVSTALSLLPNPTSFIGNTWIDIGGMEAPDAARCVSLAGGR